MSGGDGAAARDAMAEVASPSVKEDELGPPEPQDAAMEFQADACTRPLAPPPLSCWQASAAWFRAYAAKSKGLGQTTMKPEGPAAIAVSWLGAFICILVICTLNQYTGNA